MRVFAFVLTSSCALRGPTHLHTISPSNADHTYTHQSRESREPISFFSLFTISSKPQYDLFFSFLGPPFITSLVPRGLFPFLCRASPQEIVILFYSLSFPSSFFSPLFLLSSLFSVFGWEPKPKRHVAIKHDSRKETPKFVFFLVPKRLRVACCSKKMSSIIFLVLHLFNFK